MKALHSASGVGIGYNPGVTYRGGEFIAQGIGQAGGALAEGLQQFQKNREERDFADQKMQALAAQMGRYQDFEKTANEDDTSPAGKFLKTFANWDNLSLAKKKASLMDAELFVNKREAEQHRAEDQQWKLLAEQRGQEQLGLQREHLGLERGRTGMEAARTLWGAVNQGLDNLRQDRREALAEKAQADTLARLNAAAKTKAEQDAALAGFMRHFSSQQGPGLTLEQQAQSALAAFPAAGAHTQFNDNLKVLRDLSPKSQAVVDLGTNDPRLKDIFVGPQGQFLDRSGNHQQEHYDEQGNLVGRTFTQNGKPVFKAVEPGWEIRSTTDEFGNPKHQLIVKSPAGIEAGQAAFRQLTGKGGKPAPAGGGSIPTVTTQSQFDALPSGASYKGSDGRTYRKP